MPMWSIWKTVTPFHLDLIRPRWSSATPCISYPEYVEKLPREIWEGDGTIEKRNASILSHLIHRSPPCFSRRRGRQRMENRFIPGYNDHTLHHPPRHALLLSLVLTNFSPRNGSSQSSSERIGFGQSGVYSLFVPVCFARAEVRH